MENFNSNSGYFKVKVLKLQGRDSNSAARVLASWSLCNNFSGCFVLGSAPEVFVDVIVKEQTQLVIV